MLIDGDAPAVVAHVYVTVRLDRDPDVVAEVGHRLVDCVVDDFEDEVVEAAFVRAADVHAGTTADGLQPFEDLDIAGGIVVGTGALLVVGA